VPFAVRIREYLGLSVTTMYDPSNNALSSSKEAISRTFTSVTRRASRYPGLKSVLHERNYSTLPETTCTICRTFRPPASPPLKTALKTSASGNLGKDILPCLTRRCITTVPSQGHHKWALVVCFVNAGVQILPCKFCQSALCLSAMHVTGGVNRASEECGAYSPFDSTVTAANRY